MDLCPQGAVPLGSARYWQIYDIDDSGGSFVETRKTAAKCSGHCEGRFEHILAVLEDCDALFVNRIGTDAAAFMLSHQKRVFEANGAVDDIIAQLIDSNLPEDDSNCSPL